MSWADKALKKHQAEKIAYEVLNSPTYKAAREEERKNDTTLAYANFAFMALDYLELKHNYGKRGFDHFLEHVANRFDYINCNDDYFIQMNEYYKKEYGYDVLQKFGLDVEKDGDENGKG